MQLSTIVTSLVGLTTLVGAAPAPSEIQKRQTATPYSLPMLPYAYSALEPVISTEIMMTHHTKHHQVYVNNLNNATATLNAALAAKDVKAVIAAQSAINFNDGGHINHSLFWLNLAPANTTATKLPTARSRLGAAITKKWGSVDAFIAAFNTRLGTLQGSGWGWLVRDGDGELEIVLKSNQDPILAPEVPIIGIDVWEHSYYLQYRNDRATYVRSIWQVANWQEAERRFTGAATPVTFAKWKLMKS